MAWRWSSPGVGTSGTNLTGAEHNSADDKARPEQGGQGRNAPIAAIEETAKLYLLLRGAKTRILTTAQIEELQQ